MKLSGHRACISENTVAILNYSFRLTMLASYVSRCLFRCKCKSCTLVLQFVGFASARDAFSNNRRLRQLLLERLQQYEITESHNRLTKETTELPLCVERDIKSLSTEPNTSAPSKESAKLDSSMPSWTFKDFAFTEVKAVDPYPTHWLDRGFHVRSDGKIVDEYILGSTEDLPLEKQYKFDGQPGVKTSLHCTLAGSKESVETIFFQHPHQPATDYGVQKVKPDWQDFYGTEDASIPPSQGRCQGCGAQLHCVDMSLPGFVPYEIFLERQSDKLADGLCRRCFLLKKHNFLVNVNVAPIDYVKIISHLKLLQEVLIILLVDLLDFPCSFFNSLPDFIGENKSVIVLVNKADLLPLDSQSFDHQAVCQFVYSFLKEHGFCDRLNIILTKVISAKTGWGVENLITFIHRKWANKGDIYLLGCTNSGKSTLFNTLLQSDLCKVRAVDLVERATTSPWPGTTLNLLKFPLLNPTPRRVAIREARLRKFNRMVSSEERLKHLALTKRQKFSLLNGYLGMSYKQSELETEMDANDQSTTDNSVGKWNPEDPDFKRGKWFYDTPGVISDNQVLQLLTLEELILTMPRSMLKPRNYLLKPGSSLLLAGLARIDKCEGNKPVLVKVYASDCLPIFVMPSVEANEFYQKHLGSQLLKVPCGSPQRMQRFPGLQCKQVSLLEGTLIQNASKVDVVLSSIGWASFKRYPSKEDNIYTVWTPLGKGIYTRPSFV
ncbi:hypothetical protein M513_04081 [Trichuris suis]|uniref:G domain-containing protein n=1 Tax=Trichuris suis TaxID=68888 RepID=A0A085MD67_9BILA|nr:hypothetical protein M513_04081 [Trichuris suis]